MKVEWRKTPNGINHAWQMSATAKRPPVVVSMCGLSVRRKRLSYVPQKRRCKNCKKLVKKWKAESEG